MIQIHIVVYETDGGDQRFQVLVPSRGTEELTDVTEQYEVAATVDEDTGREGFLVLKAGQQINGQILPLPGEDS